MTSVVSLFSHIPQEALPACELERVDRGLGRWIPVSGGTVRPIRACSGVALAKDIPEWIPHPDRAARVRVSAGCRAGPLAASVLILKF